MNEIKPKIESLEEAFTSYRARVIHKDAGAVQVKEARRAFYAGALVLMRGTLAVADDDISEHDGVAQLASWKNELLTFFKDLKEGRA